MPRLLAAFALAVLLSGCTPGLVLNLYNATGATLTITNPPFRRVVIIPPNTARDVDVMGDVVIRSATHSWTYSQRSVVPPTQLFQQHGMIWRAFGKIDARGHIYLFAPPPDHGAPQPIPQPAGFPARPQQT